MQISRFGHILYSYWQQQESLKKVLIQSDFQAKFSEFGRLIDVHDTGNGFAFVTYNHKKVNLHWTFQQFAPGNDQEAKKAIREMNGATIAGQEIKVRKLH